MPHPAPTFLCPICGREGPESEGSRHHVLPKSQGGREIVVICRHCHRQIHSLFTVKELARRYDTLDKLTATPEMQKWIHWIRRRPLMPPRRDTDAFRQE